MTRTKIGSLVLASTALFGALLLVLSTPGLAGSSAPTVEFNDSIEWLPGAAVSGLTASAEACDADGVTSVSFHVEGIGTASTSGEATCLQAQDTFEISEPGYYHARARGADTEGNEANDTGYILARLNPFNPDNVEGYPPVDEISELELGTTVRILTLTSAEGDVLGYEVTSDGQVLISNLGSIEDEKGSEFTEVNWDRITGGTTLTVGGEVLWEGFTHRVDENWWRLRPVSQTIQSLTTAGGQAE